MMQVQQQEYGGYQGEYTRHKRAAAPVAKFIEHR